jgi:hypothetical protein
VKSSNVNELADISYQYNFDALPTQVGDLTLTRDADNGLLKGTTLGKVSTTLTHNPFGELLRYTASYEETPLYHVEYARDKLGRITDKISTLAGKVTTYH